LPLPPTPRAASCRLAQNPFAWHQTPSPGTRVLIRQKCGTILFRFNSEISLTQMQPDLRITLQEAFPLLPDVWKVDGVKKNDANRDLVVHCVAKH
jgi:hypothetical protein